MARQFTAPKKVPKRSLGKKLLAGTALALALGTTLATANVAYDATVAPQEEVSSADAHTTDITVRATCATNGTYTLDVALTLKNVPSGQAAKVEWRLGTTGAWATQATGVTGTNRVVTWQVTGIPGTTKGNSPVVWAKTTWLPDGVSYTSDGWASGLDGKCTAAPNPTVTLDGSAVCATNGTYTVTWTVTITNSGNLSEVDLKVIKHLPAGSLINGVDAQVWLTEWIEHHANHSLPPWPTNGVVTFTQSNIPGNATSATAGVQYDFKGGPSGDPEKTITLSGNCRVPDSPTASASVSTTPASCDAAGSATVTGLAHATLVGTLDLTPGTHNASFKADDKYTFPNGSKTLTVTYTIPAKLGGVECEPGLPTAAAFDVSYTCDTDSNQGQLHGERGENIVYVINGVRIPQADIPSGVFSVENLLSTHGITVTYGAYTVAKLVDDVDNRWPSRQNTNGDVELGTFQFTLTEHSKCPVTITPEATAAPSTTCKLPGSLTLSKSEYYTWSTSGTRAATTAHATPVGDFVTLTKTDFGPYDLSPKTDGCGLALTGVNAIGTAAMGIGAGALLVLGIMLVMWRRRKSA